MEEHEIGMMDPFAMAGRQRSSVGVVVGVSNVFDPSRVELGG